MPIYSWKHFREGGMPDSEDAKASPSVAPKTPFMTGVAPASRPLSSNSSHSGVHGSHSPLGPPGGRTPSPSAMGPLMGGQQLPPACGARQLSKLKRFLTTLQQFGSDISPEIGERVRALVLALVNSHMSIEEFHAKLQEATNFPLRPFVIPFLKANLPLLQRELLHCARLAKQTPQQFLTQNEHVLFDPTNSPTDMHDSAMDEINGNGKRCSPDRPKEASLELNFESPSKRHHSANPNSPVSTNCLSPGSAFMSTGLIRLDGISKPYDLRQKEKERMEKEERDRICRERERDKSLSSYNYRSPESLDNLEKIDDDWRHVETMLNCIIGMVDKTKRAMSVLQERSLRDREELQLWTRRQGDSSLEVKKRSDDVMAYTLKQTEDRVKEMRKRAEEAVQDVKRQAMHELQKAVTAADQKASDLVAQERAKVDRAIAEARRQTQSETLMNLGHQEESPESCWNCGRKASETCSGCNVARYCGSFCQHKDWEQHHHVCGKTRITSAADAREIRRTALAAAAAAVQPSSSSQTSSSREVDTKNINCASSTSSSTASSTVKKPATSTLESSSVTCMSPTPSIVPSLSAKDTDQHIAAVTSDISVTTRSPSPQIRIKTEDTTDIKMADYESNAMSDDSAQS